MEIVKNNIVSILTGGVVVAVLVWGYIRSRPYGKLGLLSWLQSLALAAPWVTFFVSIALGIYPNGVFILASIVASIVAYILLGRSLRQLARDEDERAKLEARLAARSPDASTSEAPGSPNESKIPNANLRDGLSRATGMPTARPQPDIGMSAEDLEAVRSIFGIDTFFATETIPYQSGAIFRGNLRGEPEPTYQSLESKIAAATDNRYRAFLIPNRDGKPVVVVLPTADDPKPLNVSQKLLALVLFAATIVTTAIASGLFLSFDLFAQPERWREVVPLAAGIWAIAGTHEIGHLVAARKHGVSLSWPFFLPAWQIGTFGSIVRFQSILPNRTALFDIAAAGPLASVAVSLGMMLLGFSLSNDASLFQIPTDFFRGSILVASLAKLAIGDKLASTLVSVHPLVLLGWLGLVINALNLLPAGQLDGGRIMQAIYGRRVAGVATILSLLFLGLATLVNPLALYWAILILVAQRDLERPSANELAEPDDARAIVALLGFLLVILTLIPLTPSLAARWGIGSAAIVFGG
ncbi:MAG: site-2 protease family protein [Geitlerinemataceae cyanobacterium]